MTEDKPTPKYTPEQIQQKKADLAESPPDENGSSLIAARKEED